MSTNHGAINTINAEFISGRTDYTANGEYNVNNLPASPKTRDSPHCLVEDRTITYPPPTPTPEYISPDRKDSVVNF